MTVPRKIGLIAACALGGLMASPAFAQQPAPAPTRQELAGKPWMNTHLSAAERTQLVLKEMTQEEKLRLVMGYFGTDLDGMVARIDLLLFANTLTDAQKTALKAAATPITNADPLVQARKRAQVMLYAAASSPLFLVDR